MFGKRYSIHPYAEWGSMNKPLTPREPTPAGPSKVAKSPRFIHHFERPTIKGSGRREVLFSR